MKNNDHAKILCNCRDKDICPMDGKCLTENVIYRATVSADEDTKSYIGLTGDQFKTRYRNHLKSFKDSKYRNDTCLSKYIWSLNDSNKKYTIKWKIIDRGSIFSPSTGRCNLCFKEKYFLIMRSELCEINSKTEFGSSCRHKRQFLICNYKDKGD